MVLSSPVPVGRALLDAADALDRVADALRSAAPTADVAGDAFASTPAFVSIERACSLLGLSRATVNRRVTDGTLRSRKVGGRRLIPIAAVEEMSQAAVAR